MDNTEALSMMLKGMDFDAEDLIRVVSALGEKLYEELLIDAKTSRTKQPLIYKANENFLPAEYLIPEIENLRENLIKINEKKACQFLQN